MMFEVCGAARSRISRCRQLEEVSLGQHVGRRDGACKPDVQRRDIASRAQRLSRGGCMMPKGSLRRGDLRAR